MSRRRRRHYPPRHSDDGGGRYSDYPPQHEAESPSRREATPQPPQQGRGGPRRFFGRPPKPKEIYLLPTSLTMLNMFFGFAAIVGAYRGSFLYAAGLLLLATICDGLDGRFARMMGTTSKMGKELDSLADIVSFGVAPGILVWQWAFVGQPLALSRIGWLIGFVFLSTAALRLARFNVDTENRPHFIGMPTPLATAVLAATIYFHPQPVQGEAALWAVAIGMLVLSALMVSRIPFFSVKNLDLRSPRSYRYIIPAILFIVLTAYNAAVAFLAISYFYLGGNLWAYLRRSLAGTKAAETPRPASASGAPPSGGSFHP